MHFSHDALKHLLLTTIAAVALVVCVNAQESSLPSETQSAAPTAYCQAEDVKPANPKADRLLIDELRKGSKETVNIETVKQAIADGADVNAKMQSGHTPLQRVAFYDRKEVAELLIDAGANVNAKDEFGFTALDRAVQLKRFETANLLRKQGGKHGKIHSAAYGGDAKGVKEFLAAGADVNAKDKYGRTPLHYATFGGRKEVAALLIDKGAVVNVKDKKGFTPLDRAVIIIKGDSSEDKVAGKEIAYLLRKHGGKTSEKLKAEGK
jgi:ankyrin repeat protein